MPACSLEVYDTPSLCDFLKGQYRIYKRIAQEESRGLDVEAQTHMAPTAGTGTSSSKEIHKNSSISLEARDHPFAAREGKTITWQNVNLELVS